MKTLTLKINETVFEETEEIVSAIKKYRNQYIAEALDYYNRLQKQLIKEEEKLKVKSAQPTGRA